MLKLYKSQKVNTKKSQIKTSCLNHNNNGKQIQKEQRQNKQTKKCNNWIIILVATKTVKKLLKKKAE